MGKPGWGVGSDLLACCATWPLTRRDALTWQEWYAIGAFPVTLLISFAAPTTFAAYDLISGQSRGYAPSAWDLYCRANSTTPWALVHSVAGVVPPSSKVASYALSSPTHSQINFTLLAPGVPYPALSSWSALGAGAGAGATFTACKFVFTASHGGLAGDVQLSSLDLYDGYGDRVSLSGATASSPGATRRCCGDTYERQNAISEEKNSKGNVKV